jgi:broad specificity phosphatase PhoE
MKNKTILFVRHGESLGNTGERIHVLRSDITLSDKGVEQAAAMAKELQKPDLIIVSPYLRAIQTARPVISKFPDVPVELWNSVHEFEPLSDIQHHGSTRSERSLLYAEYVAMDDCSHSCGTGAESFDEFIKRVDDTLSKLRGIGPAFIVIVSHYWFINAVLMRLNNPDVKITPKYFNEHTLDIKNTETVKVEI